MAAANITNYPAIDDLLKGAIDAGEFPSAVYLVSHKSKIVCAGALGFAVQTPQIIPARLTTIYDLASLTKPLITTLLAAQLIERGTLELDKSIAFYLSDFDVIDKREISVRQLLTHTSGFTAWISLCEATNANPALVLKVTAATPLACPPATRVIYSDLNFIALGKILERITNQSLDLLAQQAIFAPLNLQRTSFNPPFARQAETAASESFGNAYEQATARAADVTSAAAVSNSVEACCWRTHPIWNQVHDGNAYFLGGYAGHAGLFSCAEETLKIAVQFLPAHATLLKNLSTFALFTSDLTPKLNESRALGWQLAATPDSTAGTALAPESFGHTGFTGTSVWVDPKQQSIFILLTNRTHNHALPFANINRTRRAFHTLAHNLIKSNLIKSCLEK